MAEIPGTLQKKGLKRRDKVLIGCGLGCVGFLVVVGISLFGGLYWLISPGQQIDTERILGEGAVGYVRLPDPAEDAGLTDLTTYFILEADRAGRSSAGQELPGFFEKYQEMNLRNGAKGMRMWIPKDSTISFEMTPDGTETLGLAAVNLRSFPRAVRSFISAASGGGLEEHRGQKIFDMGEGDSFVAFYGTTLLAASDEALIRRAIDRLEDGSAEAATLDLGEPPPHWTELDQPWDAFGAFEGDSGIPYEILTVLLDLLPLMEDEAEESSLYGAAQNADALRFGLDVVTADTLRAGLLFTSDSPDSAALWARRLSGQVPLTLGDYDVQFHMESTAAGPEVQASFELTGLKGLLAHFLQQAERAAWEEESYENYEDGTYEDNSYDDTPRQAPPTEAPAQDSVAP